MNLSIFVHVCARKVLTASYNEQFTRSRANCPTASDKPLSSSRCELIAWKLVLQLKNKYKHRHKLWKLSQTWKLLHRAQLPARALPLFRYTQPVRQGARDGCLRREATRRSLYAASEAAVAAQVCALSHSLLDDGAWILLYLEMHKSHLDFLCLQF